MNIRVDLNYPIKDGTEVVFRSPVDCSQVTGLKVYYPDASQEFVLADAHGNNVGQIDHLFAENVAVKVILDVTTGMAFVQNADTNAYIERTFIKTINGNGPDENGNVEILEIDEIHSYIDEAVNDAYKKGTSIPSGSDLDDYRTIGKYYASSNSIAASLENCPTTQNFVMWVFIRTDSVPSQIIIDLTGKMFIRSRTTTTWRDWQTYLTDANVTKIVQEELAKYGQLKPEFANSIDECTDTTQLYVLPDGYIYAYMAHEEYPYTNQIPLSINADGTQYVGENGEDGYKRGYRFGAEGEEKPMAGYGVTGFIPAKSGDVIHLKNVPYAVGGGVNTEYLIIYNSNFEVMQAIKATDGFGAMGYLISDYTVDDDTGYATSITMYDKYESGISYIRFGVDGMDNSAIITVNEEITGEPVVTYNWTNTGHAFVPADYEDRIVKAESDIATLKQVVSGDISVYGIVDNENNILMTGTLTVGKYKLKYMNEDGTTTDIGEFTME